MIRRMPKIGREKAFGALLFIFAFLVLIYYIWGLLILNIPGVREWVLANAGLLLPLLNPSYQVLVGVPILIGVILIMVIAMWIGYTMITTPAPEPLEDFDFDETEISEDKEE